MSVIQGWKPVRLSIVHELFYTRLSEPKHDAIRDHGTSLRWGQQRHRVGWEPKLQSAKTVILQWIFLLATLSISWHSALRSWPTESFELAERRAPFKLILFNGPAGGVVAKAGTIILGAACWLEQDFA